MGCTVERVVPGTGSEDALARRLPQLRAGDALAPVFVVVRAPLVGVGLRHSLARRSPLAGVRFGSLHALVKLVAAGLERPGTHRELTDVAVASAARAVLAERPGMLAGVAGHRATEAALATSYRMMRAASPPDAESLSRLGGRVADVVRLSQRMAQLLSPHFYDSLDALRLVASEIADPLTDTAAAALSAAGPVVLYLPDPLLAEETEFVRRLSCRVDVVVLAGCTGDPDADAGTDGWVAQLAGDPATAVPEGGHDGPPRFGRVVSAPDADVEVRQAVRRLMAHAESGGDLARCIVAYPDGTGSNALGGRVAAACSAAGIPCTGGPPTPLRAAPEGKTLAGLVDLARPVPPGAELERAAVIKWLGTCTVVGGHGLASGLATVQEGQPLPVGLWDRCSRAAGVLAGLDHWRERLSSYAATSDRLRAGTTVAATYDLLTFVERLHSLTAIASASSWAGCAAWALGALEEILSPEPERAAVKEAVAEAVGDLACLDDVEPLADLGVAERMRRFGAALALTLDRAAPSPRAGRGPIAGSLSQVAGLPADVLLVVGCREGDLPGRSPGDPLVSAAERAAVQSLVPTERLADRQRRHVATLLAASGSSQASFARIDVSAGRSNYPSRWLDGDLWRGETSEIPSFFGSLRLLAAGRGAPADAGDLELAALSVAAGRRRTDFICEIDADFGRRTRAVRARRRGGLNRFAGYVGPAAAAGEAWDRHQSATTLEDLAKCPFRFFMGKMLRVESIEAPEQLVSVDPRERGNLMHGVLERFFAPYAEVGEVPKFDEAERRRLEELGEDGFAAFEAEAKTGKLVFWAAERRTIARDLQRFVAKDVAASAAEALVPIAVELDFGREDSAPVVIAAGGHEVKFRGRIDRVDRAPDGSLVVADYKSGRSDGHMDIIKRPLGSGTHLQLPIYAKAALQADGGRAVPVRAEYRFVQATAEYAVIPVQLTDDLDTELSSVLAALVSTVAEGCFPPRPGAQGYMSQYDNCRYCDFDDVCAADRQALWARAAWDPLLKPYVDLVEPVAEAAELTDGHGTAVQAPVA
ncbi:MAG: PD-(D/E)XK nuclease family protein [Acidimicrobiales bacterium]